MNKQQLCEWLRENSSGIYRPAAEAADTIDRLDALCREMLAEMPMHTTAAISVAQLDDWEKRRTEA